MMTQMSPIRSLRDLLLSVGTALCICTSALAQPEADDDDFIHRRISIVFLRLS